MELGPQHQCLIYEGAPSRQLPLLATQVKQKLSENYRCLYLNSPPMVAGMRSYLAAAGVDVALETRRTSLLLSSEQTSSVDSGFEPDRMLQTLEETLDQALDDGYTGLWATGDMTWEFGPEKDFQKLLEYEWRLEELFREQPSLYGICQYHRDTLPAELMRHGLVAHRNIFINETLSRLNPLYIESGSGRGLRAKTAELDAVISELCQCRAIN